MSAPISREHCIRLAIELVANSNTHSAGVIALWINLDRFQQVNQSLGYVDGDVMIGIIADRLQHIAGPEAHLGKMGADEFVCLLNSSEPQTAVMVAQAMMRAIEEPVELGGITLHPSACIGIASLEQDEDALSLLQRADQAMLAAKRSGGKRWLVSRAEAGSAVGRATLARVELDIESKLHQAMQNGGLTLHYQPILRADGSIDAVEALMRCTVNGESIPPSKFIPVAEKTGLVIRLGEWTLSQGALFARQLSDAGFPLKVAVNVSRAQLLAPHFSQAVTSALIFARLSAEHLELELTESLFMDMSPVVQENLCNARAAGIGLAIDDFGTGYSCLANLKDIHATKLKLDRSFVVVLPEDQRAFAIVKAMTSLGQELGMTIVAEGVETLAQQNSLNEAGVNAIQGYIYAHAMPGDTLLEWLRDREPYNNKQSEYDHGISD
ncbi:MAG TPA: bifunctional diguanylate cyclase/phosphodiesterase [Rhodocyclaceae bacterium]|nr:bifunctional diguanylate cyclase/phosphodiesterase [Rhodocyclaceae bacterium]